ncbi:hypothetical protein [Hyphomonas oceanitis]|nr:hypothetical protein [Hyphomonas oceanitis]
MLNEFVEASKERSGADVSEFNAFRVQYLKLAGPDGDKCFYGCSGGLAGDAPNIGSQEFRDYLANTAIAEAAISADIPSEAVGSILTAGALVAEWKKSHAGPPKAGNRSLADYIDSVQTVGAKIQSPNWFYLQGCIASEPSLQELGRHVDAISDSILHMPSISKSDTETLMKLRVSLRDIGYRP